MKVAVVTDDGTTISRHFGRAATYLVFTIEAGAITGREQRAKPTHRHGAHTHHEQHEIHLHEQAHGMDAESDHKHNEMVEPIQDCAALIARGMGTGAYLSLQQAGIRPFITDYEQAEAAVLAYSAGTLEDHPERLH